MIAKAILERAYVRGRHIFYNCHGHKGLMDCIARDTHTIQSPPLPKKTGWANVYSATLLRPKATAKAVSWTFLTLPNEASAKLPSRSMTSVLGTFNGLAFQATLEPDGQGGHWLKVDRKLREAAGAKPRARLSR